MFVFFFMQNTLNESQMYILKIGISFMYIGLT